MLRIGEHNCTQHSQNEEFMFQQWTLACCSYLLHMDEGDETERFTSEDYVRNKPRQGFICDNATLCVSPPPSHIIFQ